MNPEMVLLVGFFTVWVGVAVGSPFGNFNTANFTLQRIQTGSERMQLSPP